MEIPLELRNALKTGAATLFLGAGVAHNVERSQGQPTLTGAGLVRELAEKFDIVISASADLAQVAQVVEARHGREELDQFLRVLLRDLEPDDDLRWLATRTWKAIYTTNYDRIIQRAFELEPNPTQTPVTIANSEDLVPTDWRYDVPVYQLHGSLFGEGRSFALITTADYGKFRAHRGMLFDLLKNSYATSPILYVGYSTRDPNWNLTLGDVRAEFEPGRPPISYRVLPRPDPIEAEALANLGITTLEGTLSDLVEALKAEFGDLRVDPRDLHDLAAEIPGDLRSVFAESPAATMRLNANFEYVNGADFAQPSNERDVLHGETPNWAYIGAKKGFERDVESALYEEVIDYVTSPESMVRSVGVLAPAGYGVSTLLRALAVRLVREKLGDVLVLRDLGELLQGDLLFAHDHLDGPLFVFVDRASQRGTALPDSVRELRAKGANVLFVVGDRLNEWRQRNLRLSPREYVIEPLSEPEIDGLIDYLTANDALGVLTYLPRSSQAEAIRIRHGKQLLVAMKEATENRDFDSIIEDEYWSLPSDEARTLYAVVSGMHRYRLPVRDALAAAIAGIPVAEVYDRIHAGLEGVILVDDDPRTDSSLIRTRHPVIAQVVWETCVPSALRTQLVGRVIEHLNLHYPTDREVFGQLYRSDQAVDAMGDPSERRAFFDKAVAKDPTSSYIRQHYARMLLRSGELERALAKIDEAIELRPRGKLLHHTRGLILAEMSQAAVGVEVGRKRMRQSEEAFRRVISIDSRDPYGYEGLARLFLNWAVREESGEASAEFLRAAEELLSDGMISADDKSPLWVVSSEVARYLGDSPEVLRSLREAVAGDEGAKVTRYLLARELAEQGLDAEVLEVVQPVLGRLEGRDYRLALLYAQSCHRAGRPWSEATSALKLVGPSGLKDPRFAATLGAMLYMAGEFDAADEAFDRSRQRGYRGDEYDMLRFEPMKDGHPVRLSARVQRVAPGYAFLRPHDYTGDFFLSMSRAPGVHLREGLEVEFTAAFSVRGPAAKDVTFPNP
jgi:tetratricopeptide (TPR) repeat protein/cold shock CspA family protein